MAVACVKTSGQFFTSSSSSSGPSSSILSGSGSVGSGTMNGGGAGAGGGHLQSQLTRSLERILEDANLSGELKLSGRKLKDFPKAAGKFNLSDTVIADLSRNRFCELPEDITSLAFLERLLVFHNTIRSIPDTIRGLHSLTYLDLRNNQLAVMPREICFLPLQVLLVSNNRLVTLPDELGRMEELTELDAACNQITHLPPRMGDLRNLRSLTLRNNQLVYLPRDLTCLQLVFLDISCNKIATLPVELRLMGSLVDLELSNNPLTSPPASLCVRGLVHVFKYLETAAAKEEKSKCGLDGHATLRRSALTSKNSTGSLLDGTRNRRAHVDSGYSTSDGGFEGKRWSQDDPHDYGTCSPKWSPIPMHTGFAGKPPPGTSSSSSSAHQLPHSGGYSNLLSSTGGNGGLSGLLGSDYHGGGGTLEEEFRKGVALLDQQERKKLSNNNSNDISPEGDVTPDSMKADEKMRSLGNIQTYREYKEALRQQRSQSDIYRPKEQQAQTPDSGGSTGDSPLSNFSPYNKSQATTPSPSVYSSSNQSSPLSPHHSNIHKLNQINANSNHNNNNNNNNNGFNPAGPGSSPLMSPNRNIVAPFEEQQSNSSTSSTPNKRPVQKVIPSRNITSTYQQSSPSPTHLNGNHAGGGGGGGPPSSVSNGKIPIPNGTPVKTALSNSSCAEYAYVKPNSPCKASSGILTHNNVPSSIPKPTANGAGLPPANGSQKPLTATVGYVNNAKPGQKTNKTVSWNRDVPTTDKLSFTMRREFDKQKEETELIQQLRQIIETRLKMTLPEDIAPALTDGVVLCHLANHVRPRSVGSIHVPSPAVPKLTMARCRRNVDNFLDACRRIGVDEELICSCQDIVPPSPPPPAAAGTVAATIPDVPTDVEQPQTTEPEVDHVQPPNPPAMFRTVFALLHRAELMAHGPVHRPTSPPPPPPPSIIINNNINNNNNHQTGNKPSTLTAANTNTTTAEAERRDRHPISSSCGGDGEEPNGNYHRASPNPLHSFANNHLLRNTSTPNNTTNSKCPKTLLEYHFDQEEDQEDQALVAEREDVMRVQARLRAVSASESDVHRSCGGGGGGGDGRNVPATLDLTTANVGGTGGGRRKRKFPSTKFSSGGNRTQDRSGSEGGGLNEIVEECEYDSDIGKFRCRQGPDDYDDSESSMNSLDEETDAFTPTNANQGINDLNSTGTPTAGGPEPRDVLLDFNINSEENDPAGTGRKIVSKRIEFWESNAGGSGDKIVNSPLRRSVSEEDNEWKEGKQWSRKSDHPTISTILCLGTFLLTVVYLYLYPLPNY